MAGINAESFQLDFFNRTGIAPVAPPRNLVLLPDLNDLLDPINLWDSFFLNFFPEANNEWVTNEEAKALEDQGITPKRQFYQTTFNVYVTDFKKFLDDPNITPTLNDYLLATIPERIDIWEDFLLTTDVVLRHKTVYLWVIIELLEFMEEIEKTLVNQSTATLLFHQAQSKNLGKMSDESFQKMKKKFPPLDLITDQAAVEHNGEASHAISILKAHASKVQSQADEHSTMARNSRSQYQTHNRSIGAFLSQLEGLLNELIGQ